jgi:hypothetical protein
VGHRVGLDAVMAKGIKSLLCPHWESNPCRPFSNLVTKLTELPLLLPDNHKRVIRRLRGAVICSFALCFKLINLTVVW